MAQTQIKLMLASLSLALSNAAAADIASTQTINPEAALAPYGVTPSQIQAVQAVVVPEGDPEWLRGLFGTKQAMRAGSLGISCEPLKSKNVITSALRVTQAGNSLTAELCSGGKCAGLSPSSESKNPVAVKIEDETIKLLLYGNFFNTSQDGDAAFLPSWALTKLIGSGDASLPSMPRSFLAIQAADHIFLVADDGKVWLDLTLQGPAQALQRLSTTFFASNGRLVLGFSNGGLLLDFAEDLILLAKADGDLMLSTAGIGAGILSMFEPVLDGTTVGSVSTPKFLALGDSAVVTSRGVLRFNLDHRSGFKKIASIEGSENWYQANIIPKPSGLLDITILAIDKANIPSILQIDSGLQIAATVRPIAFERDKKDLELIGKDIYARAANRSLKLLTSEAAGSGSPDGNLVPEFLDDYIVRATGDILVSRSLTGGVKPRCEWSRQRTKGADAGSFREDGSIACDCADNFSANLANAAGTMTAVTWSADKIALTTWWATKEPAK